MTTVKFNKGIVYIDNKIVGNVKEHVFRQGTSSTPGTGTVDGNVKNDVIRAGLSSTLGTGSILGNVKNEYVYRGSSSTPGTGTRVDKVSKFTIPGMERESDADIVAAYHFFIKKFL